MKLLSWLRGDKIEKMLIGLATPQIDYEPLDEKVIKSALDREKIEERLRRPSGVVIGDLLAGANHD